VLIKKVSKRMRVFIVELYYNTSDICQKMLMPELPEVETIARQLRSVLLHKVVSSVDVRKEKSWSGEVAKIVGSPIESVSRRAKILRFRFTNGSNIIIHLKMSGQLIYVDGEMRVGGGHPTSDWVSELPSSHTRVALHFDDGTHLFFNDQRIFGWMRVVNDDQVTQAFSLLAPDIIDDAITPQYLFEKSAKKRIPIKQFIMDNQVVSGVGNIYACDALNLAKIAPTRPANTLSMEKIQRLTKAMKEVVFLGIEKGGATSDGKYVNVSGMAGKYQDFMRVYDKKGEPCPNCGAMIEKMKIGGRGTYFCPNCQK
jgi:formamidopyrimidine-DNA glycosylase